MVERYKPKTPLSDPGFGVPKGGKKKANSGRKKGVPNTFTTEIKAAFLTAIHQLGDMREVQYRDSNGKIRTRRLDGPGGIVGYCKFVARKYPEMGHRTIDKMIPGATQSLQLSGAGGGPVKVESMNRVQLVAELHSRGIPVDRIFDDTPMKMLELKANEGE